MMERRSMLFYKKVDFFVISYNIFYVITFSNKGVLWH